VHAALAQAELPPSNLVLEITESTLIENPQLVRAVLRELLELGVTVEPAEGIEDAEQLNVLTALGCECGQGFHFGRPIERGRMPSRPQPRDRSGSSGRH
jgi:EAL domain-containing protein (putative c-di-GMP-specific phosphodiesterase class I)